MAKSLIDNIGPERAEQLIGDAIAEQVRKANALGLPQAVKIDGVWCRQYPDGRIEAITEDQGDAGR